MEAGHEVELEFFLEALKWKCTRIALEATGKITGACMRFIPCKNSFSAAFTDWSVNYQSGNICYFCLMT